MTILNRIAHLHRTLNRVDLPPLHETRLLVKLADLSRELETLLTLTANLVEDEKTDRE